MPTALADGSPAYWLWYSGNPPDVLLGDPIPVEVTVANHVTQGRASCFSGDVTVALRTDSTGGLLSGTTTVRAVNGVARFNDLHIDSAGVGYQLSAYAPEVSAEIGSSRLFNVDRCTNGCWLEKADMPTARANEGIAVVSGVLYAIGGFNGPFLYDTVEAYDPVTNRWSPRASMPTPRSEFGVGVVNGIIYAVGGYGPGDTLTLGTVEAYNPATNSWSSRASMPTPRLDLAVGVVDGIIYAVGGTDTHDRIYNTVEAYNPATNTWTARAPMQTGRAFFGVGVVNGILYAVGGTTCLLGSCPTPGPVTASVEAYNPLTNNWAARAPMLTLRTNFGVGVSDGVVYVVAGEGIGLDSVRVEAYDPTTDAWSSKTPIGPNFDLLAEGVGVINGVFYVVGGYSRFVGTFLSDNWGYRP